jgi:hypothetical protein
VVAGGAVLALAVLASPLKLCVVAALVHVPCPGCGLTRAAFAMARGDLARAFALHPLSLVLVPMLAWIAASHALRYVRTGSAWTDAPTSRAHELTLAASALLLVVIWVARFCGFLGGPVPV